MSVRDLNEVRIFHKIGVRLQATKKVMKHAFDEEMSTFPNFVLPDETLFNDDISVLHFAIEQFDVNDTDNRTEEQKKDRRGRGKAALIELKILPVN